MRVTLFSGILAALALTTPACGGGGGGGGGGPLGGLEGEASLNAMSADDIDAMCTSLGSKAGGAMSNVGEIDAASIAGPACAVMSALGGEGFVKATTVQECNATVNVCLGFMTEMLNAEEGGIDMPTSADIQQEATDKCLADDWSACDGTIEELTACSNDWTGKSILLFSQMTSGYDELKKYDCNKAMAASEATLKDLIDSMSNESDVAAIPVPSCAALAEKCDNNTMAQLTTVGGESDDPSGSSGGGSGGGFTEEDWDGVPVITDQTCCESSEEPGCANTECVECVCASDDFCCLQEWDNFCTNTAENSCVDSCGCG